MKNQGRSDPRGHIPMHPLAFQALLVLLDGALHGYGIAKEIEAREGGAGAVLPTNLYRRLRDLARKGIILESRGEDGSQKTLFSITAFGREVAQAEAQRLETLVGFARGQDLLPSSSGEG